MGKATPIELLEIVHPGITERLIALGGTFIDADRCPPTTSYDAKDQLARIATGVRTVLPDGKVIQILTRSHRDGPLWRNSGYYSYHCGPTKDDMANVFFRVDLHPPGLHCHIRGHGKPGATNGGHLFPHQVVPDIKVVDAMRFLDYVNEFLEKGEIPFKKFGP